ncbi:hypothetical protein GCM10011504_47650 [Siccirubricoccus deserti]|uniref:DUF6456 domain-containing protein n=1 Tax=Siccirubricoccus deserti TaxID=2013562 RepID=A0A9X0R2K2_9PROT|nr:DUF6456 domain-containing protein [Siccirubricoccus deserti]MBC4018195.1 hypothetical protein [Siccirubricoccus deserti]GGC63895.1 hypothetical protein GCM10011504_47650 [Siccirubricoccus deserti]
MAGKRRAKRITQSAEDLSKPSKWRLQHGGFSEPIREADPETGSPVQHRRAVDTIGLMLTNGTITAEMHDAAVLFRTRFRAAALDALQPMPWDRVPGGVGDGMTERQAMARRHVAEAMDVLGGFGSAAGSTVWHVVGLERSVREWAQRQGWGGRPVGAPQAQGMLVAALCVLASHYGLTPGRRAA